MSVYNAIRQTGLLGLPVKAPGAPQTAPGGGGSLLGTAMQRMRQAQPQARPRPVAPQPSNQPMGYLNSGRPQGTNPGGQMTGNFPERTDIGSIPSASLPTLQPALPRPQIQMPPQAQGAQVPGPTVTPGPQIGPSAPGVEGQRPIPPALLNLLRSAQAAQPQAAPTFQGQRQVGLPPAGFIR
jgi:hypothetical protein